MKRATRISGQERHGTGAGFAATLRGHKDRLRARIAAEGGEWYGDWLRGLLARAELIQESFRGRRPDLDGCRFCG